MSPEDLPFGLGGTPVNHLVRAWLAMGLRVSVATLSPDVDAASMSVHRTSRLALAIGPYRAKHRARDAFLLERQAVRNGLARLGPDVVSAHWSYEFALGAIGSGIPTMVTVHDVPSKILRKHLDAYRLIRWFMHRHAVSHARHVVFNSPYTRSAVRVPRRIPRTVVANPIPERLFQMLPRPAPDPRAPAFVSINNGFSNLKNVRTLLLAFRHVLRSSPGARLTLVGYGFEVGGPAERWARRHGLEMRVDFIGAAPYEKGLEILRDADVLVHPSLEESFGYTLIEAAAVGTPVIGGARSGAVPWLLEGGRTGLLADVHDPSALARSMLDLVWDERTWEHFRSTAHHRARERFSATRVAGSYEVLLRGLLP